MTNPPWARGAAQLAAAIRHGETTSRAVLEAHLARIDAVNPAVNAVAELLTETARADADAADAALARGADVGPLHGVPVSIKINVDVAGSPTSDGLPAFATALPAGDAPLVARLRAAGAIPFARTNMPDLGLRWHTESALHGATRNPWDAGRTPGGSSGGEAAAIATGMSPLGIGNDVGGSVRWPSQCCGTSALRPTAGRVPHHASTLPVEMPLSFQLFLTDGPMARRIEDLRLALAVIAGESTDDPWSVSTVRAARDRPLRVACTFDPGGRGCEAGIADGVRRAAEILRARGCVVEEAEPASVQSAFELWGALLAAEARTLVAPLAGALLSRDARIVFDHLCAQFPTLDLPAYMAALAQRTTLLREWQRFFTRYDVLLGPVSCAGPFRVGADLTADAMAGILHANRLVTACNVLGLPAVALPVGIADGLPQAVQVIGGRHRDETCLDVAQLIEAAVPAIVPIDPR